MERDPSAEKGEILEDKKEKSKKKKSKIAEFISSKFSKIFRSSADSELSQELKPEATSDPKSLKGRLLNLIGIKPEIEDEKSEKQDLEDAPETHEPSRFEKFRQTLSKLNVFEKRQEVEKTKLEAAPIEQINDAQQEIQEQYLDLPQAPNDSVAQTSEKPHIANVSKQSMTNIEYDYRHRQEHKKQNKQNKKNNDELKTLNSTSKELAKENETLSFELENAKKAINHLEKELYTNPAKLNLNRNEINQTVDTTVKPQVAFETKSPDQIIEEKTEVRVETKEHPSKVEKSVELKESISSNADSIQHPEERVESVERMRPSSPQDFVEQHDNKKKIIEEIVNRDETAETVPIVDRSESISLQKSPEINEISKSRKNDSKANHSSTAGAVAQSNNQNLTDVQSQAKKRFEKKKSHVDTVKEIYSVALIIVIVVLGFGLLAIVLIN